MNKIAYFDCFSGASGDMLLATLLDVGLSLDDLKADLAQLDLADYELTAELAMQKGISGTQFDVIDGGQERPARNLHLIEKIISESGLNDRAKARSLAVFVRLAEAEAEIHGTTIDHIHFHEIGAVDSLVDIVGFVCALDRLGIEQVYASPLSLGNGVIHTEHGRLPVPAPATLKILASVNAPVVPTTAQTELVTPTGAVLLAHFAAFSRPAMRIEAVGYGLGRKQLDWANALRVWLGTPLAAGTGLEEDHVVLLECNLDDTPGETLGYAMQQLLAAGALDVWFTPIQMKKNRPAVTLSVLCNPDDRPEMERIILSETSTLGIRVQRMERAKAGRRMQQVETPWGTVRVKVKLMGGKAVSASPEYEDCARLALTAGVPLWQVIEGAKQAAGTKIIGNA